MHFMFFMILRISDSDNCDRCSLTLKIIVIIIRVPRLRRLYAYPHNLNINKKHLEKADTSASVTFDFEVTTCNLTTCNVIMLLLCLLLDFIKGKKISGLTSLFRHYIFCKQLSLYG